MGWVYTPPDPAKRREMIQVHRKPWAGGSGRGLRGGLATRRNAHLSRSLQYRDSLQKRGSEPMFLSLHNEVIPLFYTQTCLRTSQELPSALLGRYVFLGKRNFAAFDTDTLICKHNLCKHSSKPGTGPGL